MVPASLVTGSLGGRMTRKSARSGDWVTESGWLTEDDRGDRKIPTGFSLDRTPDGKRPNPCLGRAVSPIRAQLDQMPVTEREFR